MDEYTEMMDMQTDRPSTHTQTEETPSGKWIPVAIISIGLLCIVLALPFIVRHYQPPSDFDPKCDNVTAERDELQRVLQKTHQDLAKEKEDLMRNHRSLETRNRQITEEIDKLKRTLEDINNYTSEGWVYFRGSVYLGSSTEQSWEESRRYCQQRGADLAIISSEQEQEFARLTFPGRRWIGLSDLEQDGVWKWVDGSPVTTRFWGPGEPNNVNKAEHCGELNFTDQLNNWNDFHCPSKLKCICEKITT